MVTLTESGGSHKTGKPRKNTREKKSRKNNKRKKTIQILQYFFCHRSKYKQTACLVVFVLFEILVWFVFHWCFELIICLQH